MPSSPSFPRRVSSAGMNHLPPPPPPPLGVRRESQLGANMAASMTIDEMRALHQHALREAEAKRTELRLVLASRYRELVGSSDEVLKMNERSQELHDLVHNLPKLLEKLTSSVDSPSVTGGEKKETREDVLLMQIKKRLSMLPRETHRALDVLDVYRATTTLIELFTLISSLSDSYPLANALAKNTRKVTIPQVVDPSLTYQTRMIFLQVQTLPRKIERIATNILMRSASYGRQDPRRGAFHSVAALVSLDMLAIKARPLLDLYYDSKSQLLLGLLNKLAKDDQTNQAADILSKIVLVLQYDALLHPYQIFVLKQVPSHDESKAAQILNDLPTVPVDQVRAKCSQFMTKHLPMVRSKAESVLVSIAGTTASALGQIRQALYDRTDGTQSLEILNGSGVGTWDDAIEMMVDARNESGRFSLWNALFSNTFSSLVHSLLTTAFQSVHLRTVSALRTSVACAPPAHAILPHEAHRNTLQIATDLNMALQKVSEDAHELLVHAEERVESERRLRESLFVQTCEILGRLVCELRRMVFGSSDQVTCFIVGRLCFLLKFRLLSLPVLLDSASAGTTGMISYVDLQSAFELADHDEDCLISFEEALEAVESAFSGTSFRGAEMLRETLLLSSDTSTPEDVTLDELALLTARGLRHETTGSKSALGAFQKSLDKIIDLCFAKWADSALANSRKAFASSLQDFVRSGSNVSTHEWKRLYGAKESQSVSAMWVGYFLEASSIMNCNTCPSDAFLPFPSPEFAAKMEIGSSEDMPTLLHTLRCALTQQILISLTEEIEKLIGPDALSANQMESFCSPFIMQLYVDLSFVLFCFFNKESRSGVAAETLVSGCEDKLNTLCGRLDEVLQRVSGVRVTLLESTIMERHKQILASNNVLLASLIGRRVSFENVSTGSTNEDDAISFLPLASSRRFALLPVPADRSATEIQLLHGKYSKEAKEDEAYKKEMSSSGNVIGSSLGFLQSMLAKNR